MRLLKIEYRVMAHEVEKTGTEGVGGKDIAVTAAQVVRESTLRTAPNGVQYAAFGKAEISDVELERLVQTVPAVIALALKKKSYYFVPLALTESRGGNAHNTSAEDALIAADFTAELGDQAICHRDVDFEGRECVFISTRLMNDRFALAFEFFINVGHAFLDVVGAPASFAELVWTQASADVRGETSQDAWESRNLAKATEGRSVDEKAKNNFIESALADGIAVYMLSLFLDFDYSELREREYPLLAPQALAARLRHVAELFPPNAGYEFAVRYRRRA